MVELILLERVEKLGQMGQIVKVKPGFARNFLLPQKKAMRATKDNLAYFETQRAQLEATNLSRKAEAEAVAGKLDGLRVVVIRQAGESGQLYGSVSSRDIAQVSRTPVIMMTNPQAKIATTTISKVAAVESISGDSSAPYQPSTPSATIPAPWDG